MNKQEYIEGLKNLNLPTEEFIVLAGGALLLRGIRDSSADFDLCVSKKLAKEIDLYHAPKDAKGFYTPFEKCQMMDNFEEFDFDIVEGFQCMTLENILEFKRKKQRPKDLADIKKIEEYLATQHK